MELDNRLQGIRVLELMNVMYEVNTFTRGISSEREGEDYREKSTIRYWKGYGKALFNHSHFRGVHQISNLPKGFGGQEGHGALALPVQGLSRVPDY